MLSQKIMGIQEYIMSKLVGLVLRWYLIAVFSQKNMGIHEYIMSKVVGLVLRWYCEGDVLSQLLCSTNNEALGGPAI